MISVQEIYKLYPSKIYMQEVCCKYFARVFRVLGMNGFWLVLERHQWRCLQLLDTQPWCTFGFCLILNLWVTSHRVVVKNPKYQVMNIFVPMAGEHSMMGRCHVSCTYFLRDSTFFFCEVIDCFETLRLTHARHLVT